VRFIAATNSDLARMVSEGHSAKTCITASTSFRCYCRRCDRRDDIPLLVTHFLEKFAPGTAMHVSRAAMRALMAYTWPGNVRQLENAIERAVALSAGRNEIDLVDLPPEIQASPQTISTPFVDFPDNGLDLPAYLSSIERDLIRRSLERTGGNRNKAAELLRIKRTTLVEKLKRIGDD
jgi:DNA-binding NtrC family response regulator